ncbi:hypothetical protein [Pantoea anthophila]|uniref:hypothetical protein n=1 Tax=Pantoea anthophila TaxID=470931 RepID=UPI002784FC7A|nr:hypothetical protein [Pantoea anthophila]MDQ1214964.1 hypothetical protein [Pantoea anthophila]
MKEQLQLIKKKDKHFLTNDILCSIRIDFDIAGLLIEDAEISTLAKSMPFLRLKVYENFPNIPMGKVIAW